MSFFSANYSPRATPAYCLDTFQPFFLPGRCCCLLVLKPCLMPPGSYPGLMPPPSLSQAKRALGFHLTARCSSMFMSPNVTTWQSAAQAKPGAAHQARGSWLCCCFKEGPSPCSSLRTPPETTTAFLHVLVGGAAESEPSSDLTPEQRERHVAFPPPKQ